jgi:hypothetical protein
MYNTVIEKRGTSAPVASAPTVAKTSPLVSNPQPSIWCYPKADGDGLVLAISDGTYFTSIGLTRRQVNEHINTVTLRMAEQWIEHHMGSVNAKTQEILTREEELPEDLPEDLPDDLGDGLPEGPDNVMAGEPVTEVAEQLFSELVTLSGVGSIGYIDDVA